MLTYSSITRSLILAAGVLVALATLAPAVAPASPQGRTYEMVSPVYKGGYAAAAIVDVAPDGEGLVFESQGAFAGAPSDPTTNPYLARRTPSGWRTESLAVPARLAPFTEVTHTPLDLSGDLEQTLNDVDSGPNSQAASRESETSQFYIHSVDLPDTPETYEAAGQIGYNAVGAYDYLGASADLSQVVLSSADQSEPIAEKKLLPEAPPGVRSLYDLEIAGEHALRLVALNNEGTLIDPHCPSVLGASSTEYAFAQSSLRGAISEDGTEIFFTTNANVAEGEKCKSATNPAILFVRLAGQRTVQIAKPLPVGCSAPAPCATASQAQSEFVGASSDGARVYFSTTQPLVNEDRDDANDLYLATLGCSAGAERCAPSERQVDSLMQVSHSIVPGEAAEVQGVLALSRDGSHVAFVAHGVLDDAPNAEGRLPVKGADNLYVDGVEAGAPAAFVGDLCSDAGVSGEVGDPQCPAAGDPSDVESWTRGAAAEMTGDGRFVVFKTHARLRPSDTNEVQDIYRYDAANGRLDRVSGGEDGYDDDGNGESIDPVFGETPAFHFSTGEARASGAINPLGRAISEDGTRIVFATSERLSPKANGQVNAYEWHKEGGSTGEGAVSLVSTGTSANPVEDVQISPSGRDIFFVTTQGLVPQDTDNQADIYDARLEGGFQHPLTPPEPCEGDACQGPLTPAIPVAAAGSETQPPGENVASAPASGSPKAKPKRSRAKCRKDRHRVRGKCVRSLPRKSTKGKHQ